MRDKELLNELIIESREHLQGIEPDLLALEQEGAGVSDERINRIFRAVHSIKGGFAFFGVEKVVRLSHIMESIVGAARDKKLVITPEITDVLLRGLDKLRLILDDIGNIAAISIDSEMQALEPFVAEEAPREESRMRTADVAQIMARDGLEEDPVAAVQTLLPGITADQVMTAAREGKILYQVTINTAKDVTARGLTPETLFAEWEKVGEVLVSNPSREEMAAAARAGRTVREIWLVFATVLEPDLIGDALQVPQEQVLTVNLDACKQKVRLQKPAAAPAEGTRENGAHPQAAASASASPSARSDAGMEDALRVRVGLLNNLMNYAGELVLARNQLMQMMNRRCTDSPLAERNTKQFLESVRGILRAQRKRTFRDDVEENKALDEVMAQLEKSVARAFGFPLSEVPGVVGIAQNIDMVTTMLQESIMQTRLQPISVVFSKFPRVIRDLAKKLGKDISLEQEGQDVELDKSIIELLSDPLTHLVRNCADHGIEPPEQRQRAGKSRTGRVLLKAYQEGGKVIIVVEDDGAGINLERVKQKALAQGLVSPEKLHSMSAKDLELLIFAPGFSTATTVSDVSGRGVGMDVVKTNVEKLGGSVEVDSEPGKGTRITMKLPLTLAIIPSLIVVSETRRFAIPQVSLEEIVRIRANDVGRKIERIHDSEVLRLREKLLPLVRLSDVLGVAPTFPDPASGERLPNRRRRLSDRRGLSPDAPKAASVSPKEDRREGSPDRRTSVRNAVKVVVLRLENNRFGLIVDEVLDSEEIVVKPLPEYLKGCACYAGATIMGDGKVAMILDPNGIAALAGLDFRELQEELDAEKARGRRDEQRKLENVLLFSIGGPERLAVKLSEVARIEKRKTDEILLVGSKEFVKNGNATIRLVRLENHLPVQPPAGGSDTFFLIVPKHAHLPLALCAREVWDAVQTELAVDNSSVKGTGVQGSAIIAQKMTVVLDMSELLAAIEQQM